MQKAFTLTRKSRFTGKRMVGFDSSVLLDLIDNPNLFSSRIYILDNYNQVLFTHEICLIEVNRKLCEWGKTKEQAHKEIADFLEKHKLSVVKRNFEKQDILHNLIRKCNEHKIEIHPPDSWIIADFAKSGINKVHSTNIHFRQACELIGIDAPPFPTINNAIKDKFKELFGFNQKYRRNN